MKRIKSFLVIMVGILMLLPLKVKADGVNVYMFYGKTCPHCEAESKYLDSIKDKYNLNIYKYEVWYSEENQKTLKMISKYLNFEAEGVPYTIIANLVILGYNETVTNDNIIYNIKLASRPYFVDKAGIKLGVVDGSLTDSNQVKKTTKQNVISIFNTKFNLDKTSAPLSAALTGLGDSFNVCSLWIILFLIISLIGSKKKYIIFLTGIFYLTSLALLTSNILTSPSYLNEPVVYTYIKTILGMFIAVSSITYLKKYLSTLYEDKKIKKGFDKFFKKIRFPLEVMGVIILSFLYTTVLSWCSSGRAQTLITYYKTQNFTFENMLLYAFLYSLCFITVNYLITFILNNIIFKIFKNKYKYTRLVKGILLFILGVFVLMIH